MICRLCTKANSTNTIDMFSPEGLQLEMAKILEMHFWFDPREDDPISTLLCTECWNNVQTFHTFYTKAAEAEKALTELPMVNFETALVDVESLEVEEFVQVELSVKEDLLSTDTRYIADDDDDTNEVIDNIDLEDKDDDEESNAIDKFIAGVIQINCDLCTKSAFGTFRQLVIHFRNEHNQNAYMKCCDRKWRRRRLLYNHVQKHLNPEIHKCTLCNKSFSDKLSIKYHMQAMHATEDEKIYKCDECPESFARSYWLKMHKWKHIPESEMEFGCNNCNKRFPSQRGLTLHIRCAHQDKYKIVCHICAVKVSSKYHLDRHISTHHSYIDKVKCPICRAQLKNDYTLKNHLKLHEHSDENPIEIKCPHCDTISYSKTQSRNHIRTYHTDTKFICHICDKEFRKSQNLKEHMSIHTGEALHKCQYCDREFNSKSNHCKHLKRMHKDEWESRDFVPRRTLKPPVNEGN